MMIVKRGGDRGRLLILLNVFLFPFLLSVSLSLSFPSFFLSFAFLPCPLSSSLFSVFPSHFHPSLARTLLLPHALNPPFFPRPFILPLPSPSHTLPFLPLFVALSFPPSTPSHSSLCSPSHPPRSFPSPLPPILFVPFPLILLVPFLLPFSLHLSLIIPH